MVKVMVKTDCDTDERILRDPRRNPDEVREGGMDLAFRVGDLKQTNDFGQDITAATSIQEDRSSTVPASGQPVTYPHQDPLPTTGEDFAANSTRKSLND